MNAFGELDEKARMTYFRAIARLAEIAETAERAIGLEPLSIEPAGDDPRAS